MPSFWPPIVVRFLIVFCAGAVVAFAAGERWGYLTAILGLLGLIGAHLFYLNRVVEWVETPTGEHPDVELPQGFGAWQSVMRALRQARRRDEDRRTELAGVLDRFIAASSALPDGIVILDRADRLEWANPRAAEHFGLDAERDRGFFVSNLIRRPAFTDYLLREDFSEPLVLTDDTRGLALSVQLLPFQDSRRILVSRDISQLRRVEAMRQDFIANVSHELRTPLTVVCGFLEHLIDDPSMPRDERARIEALMLDQSRRMRRLIDDLLTLSKLETAAAPPAEDPFTLAPLAADAIEAARALSSGKHSIDAPGIDDWTITGAREEIESALENLLSNAVRYTPAGGSITLSAVRADRELRIEVADTGPGIAPEHIPRLTERFYRVDKSRSRESGGTGLGLAIVKHVLARHGGRLEIESEPGRGSRFAMVLPSTRVVGSAE